jgi:predicted transcriptional regulator
MQEKEERLKLKKVSQKKQQAVYDIARKFGGETTVSDIYANSNLTIDDIEEVLAELNSKDYIKTKFNDQTSIIKYIFPEIKRDYLNEKRSLAEKVGLDKLVLRLKYGNLNQKPLSDLEKAILQTAQEFSGRLTMAKIVEYTGLSVSDAEAILSGLSAKNICRKELVTDLSNIEYTFPEIVETAEKRKEIEDDNVKTLNFPKSFSKRLLKNFRKGTDRYLIKGKVRRFRWRSRQNLALDTLAPGFGHLMDKRWNMPEYFLYFLIPFFMTAGLSYIPSMVVTRNQTLKYYTISEKDLNKNLVRLNRNSLIYSVLLLFLYFKLIGLEGFISYYAQLLSLIGF